MYDGTQKVPVDMFWTFEGKQTASTAPFYFDGITFDEFFVEMFYYDYHHATLARKHIKYKPVRKQLEDGDISVIPSEYKFHLPFPEKCTAYIDLVKVA